MSEQIIPESTNSYAERRAIEIADKVVPAYRAKGARYSCTGQVARCWQAAYDGALAVLPPPASMLFGIHVVENSDGAFVASFATKLLADFFVDEGGGCYRHRSAVHASRSLRAEASDDLGAPHDTVVVIEVLSNFGLTHAVRGIFTEGRWFFADASSGDDSRRGEPLRGKPNAWRRIDCDGAWEGRPA